MNPTHDDAENGHTLKSAEELQALLVSEVIKRRPALGKVLAAFGKLTLSDYARSLVTKDDGVSHELAEIIRAKASAVLGDKIASLAADQLRSFSSVVTADHHHILFSYRLFQNNFLIAYAAKASQCHVLPVFSFGDVPLNNFDFPRGITWGKKKVPIFPERQKHDLVFGCPAFTEQQCAHLPMQVREVFGKAKASLFAQKLYSDQITIANAALWENAVAAPHGFPHIVYLQAEDISIELLKNSIQRKDDLFDILFDPETRSFILELFEGIPGCWTSTGKGTHFFWMRGPDGQRVALRIENDSLVSHRGTIALTPDAIVEALETRRLLPGLLLTYLEFLKHKVRCLGGFMQVDYLTQMSALYRQFLEHFGHTEAREALCAVRTDGYSCGPLFFFDDDLDPGSMDAFLIDSEKAFGQALRGLESLSLYQSNAFGLVPAYNAIVPEPERIKDLSGLSIKTLVRACGIKEIGR